MNEAPDSSAAPAAESPAPAEAVAPVAGGSPLGVAAPAAEGEAEKPAAGEEGAAHEGEAAPSEGEPPAEGEEAPAPLTPESYEFKLPEGVSIDETALGALKQTLAENKVAPEVAQSLLEMHVAQLNASAEAFAAAQKASWDETISGWKTTIAADAELGGDHAPHVTSTIAQALDEYGDAETRQAFDLTGSGWNPSIIKFVYRMANALREGSPHPAPGPSPNKTKTPGETLYPDAAAS